jgi:predicted amidohydrolase YtcJ
MPAMRNAFLLLAAVWMASSCVGHESEFARSLAVRTPAELILMNGKIVTVDKSFSIKEAVAIRAGQFVAVGTDGELRAWTGPRTRVVNLGGRTVIPGLIDSHIHATEAAITWDSEVHWELMQSLSDGLRQVAAAAKAQPVGSWIVVAGGWVPAQFVERRFPTRADLDAVAPDHPVYVQYLRQGALLNSAALTAVGIRRDTPDPPGGRFERDPKTAEPTGMLLGRSAWEYAHNKIPRPNLDRIHQSIRSCFRELNRLGLTSLGDVQTRGVTFAHRRLLSDMARRGELTVRLNYYIGPAEAVDELEQLRRAAAEVKQLARNDLFRFAGFGETLIHGTGDGGLLSNTGGFAIDPRAREKFRALMLVFAREGYSLHLHATQDQTARQLLDVIEDVGREAPFLARRITFAHLEDATPETVARIKRLGGGLSVQDRLLLTGERSLQLRGPAKMKNAPPLRSMIKSGIPLGAGSDGFRSGNYSPMLSLWWLITGKSIAGTPLREGGENVSREDALRMYTLGGAWFTFEEDRKGSIEVGKFADLAVLSGDYLTVPEDQIRSLQSLMTLVGGRVVYSAGPFAHVRN